MCQSLSVPTCPFIAENVIITTTTLEKKNNLWKWKANLLGKKRLKTNYSCFKSSHVNKNSRWALFMSLAVMVVTNLCLQYSKLCIRDSAVQVYELCSSLTCASSARACVLPLSPRSRLCMALWEKARGRVSWPAWPSPALLSDTPTRPWPTPFSSTEWGSIRGQKEDC